MRKGVAIHLRCTISKVAPEGFGRTKIILLGESKVNQHGNILIREQNIRGSSEKFRVTKRSK